MKKVNDLFGKSVIHQSTGNRIATVADVVLDGEVRRVVALVVNDGGSHVVRWEAISGIGDVIVVHGELPLPSVGDDDEVSDLLRNANRITGTTIVSDGGEKVGTVGDLFIDEEGLVVGYAVSQGLFKDLRGRKFLPAEGVHAVGKDAVIVSAAELASLRDSEQEDDEEEVPALEGRQTPVLEDGQAHARGDDAEEGGYEAPDLMTPPERRERAEQS